MGRDMANCAVGGKGFSHSCNIRLVAVATKPQWCDRVVIFVRVDGLLRNNGLVG
jgi:hypothetical protein